MKNKETDNFKKFVDQSRSCLLNTLAHIKDLDQSKQLAVLSKLRNALENLDGCLRELDLPVIGISTSEQINKIWTEMNSNSNDYKLMALRLEPDYLGETKISGYLETFHLPTTIPDIIEKVGIKYGGGKYSLRVVDDKGRFVKTKTFEITGIAKIPVGKAQLGKE